MPSSLIGSDLGVLADGSGHGSVAVADMDSNAQTMDWLLNTPEIQDPAGESDMGEDLSVAAGSDTLSDDLVEVPDVSQSDPADADPSPEPVPASTVSRPDPVWAVSTPDSAPVRVAPGMAPELVIVAHLPDCLPQSMGASQTNAVATRVGRHVKPPNRVICEMSTQKVEDVSPSGSVMNLFKCMFVA